MTAIELDHLFHFQWRQDRSDWAAYEALPREGTPFKIRLFVVPLILSGMAFELTRDWLPALHPARIWGLPGEFVTLVGLVLGYFAIVAALLTSRRAARIRNRPLPTTDTVLTANLRGCVVSQDGGTQLYPWDDIDVISTPTHVFLCTDPIGAIVVPRRAFETDADMAIFADVAAQLTRSFAEPTDISTGHPNRTSRS